MKDNMWRIQISVLWIADVVALAAAFILAMFESDYLNGLISGQLEGMDISIAVLLMASFFWIVPLFMMYLSLVLPRSIARWLNIIFGLILGLLNLFDLFNQISSMQILGIARTIMIALMAVVPLLIAWHAWKWPAKIE